MKSRFRPFAPLLFLLASCEAETPPRLLVAGGDPERGRVLVADYGCPACHLIPGVRGPEGVVGPPLDGFADRGQIAGFIPNFPGYLVAWLRDPPALAPMTGMPDMGVGEADARDMAAFLYTTGGGTADIHPPIDRRASVPAGQQDEARPDGHGWADRQDGLARIPVGRAVELIEGGTWTIDADLP
ncbi:MAG TPA: c-type cytochrome [Arenibaculum sp.]|nr:c-type cytochrome [Arenibaculum sp.]